VLEPRRSCPGPRGCGRDRAGRACMAGCHRARPAPAAPRIALSLSEQGS